MSRVGLKNITLPEKVAIKNDNGALTVEGPKGKLEYTLPEGISLTQEEGTVTVSRATEARRHKALHGTARSLVNNMIIGVTDGYTKDLEIIGVGFRAAVKGSALDLSLGKSHPILHPIPSGLTVTVTENTKVKVEGIDKQEVGQFAAEVRAYYKPEPYKGKGVRYVGEYRKKVRQRIHRRIRKKVSGTADRPRLAVSYSNQHVYAQVIDDVTGNTLCAASSLDKSIENGSSNAATAAKVGALVAERAKEKSIEQVVFDRGGHLFHGKIKSLADSAREAGLNF